MHSTFTDHALGNFYSAGEDHIEIFGLASDATSNQRIFGLAGPMTNIALRPADHLRQRLSLPLSTGSSIRKEHSVLEISAVFAISMYIQGMLDWSNFTPGRLSEFIDYQTIRLHDVEIETTDGLIAVDLMIKPDGPEFPKYIGRIVD